LSKQCFEGNALTSAIYEELEKRWFTNKENIDSSNYDFSEVQVCGRSSESLKSTTWIEVNKRIYILILWIILNIIFFN
jgi:hypothetical protein